MKKLTILIVTLISSISFAFKNNDININAGFGAFGSRGLFGISGEKFFTEYHAATLAFGLDFVGATTAIGYKYFTDKVNEQNQNSNLGKCFFLFECDSHIYFGPSIQYAGGSKLKIIESANEREYKIDPKLLGLMTVGFRDVFKNNLTLDFEISYRGIISGGQSTQTAGSIADDRRAIEMGYRSVGINAGIGYLF